MRRPCRPPFLGVAFIVPVGCVLPVIFPAALTVRDAVSVRVQFVDLPTFRAPCSVGVQRSERQHNVGVGISVAFVMYGNVGAHPRVNKSLLYESPD